MTRVPRTAAVLLAGLLATGCATVVGTVSPGPQRTQTRPVGAVSAVELAGSGELVVTGAPLPRCGSPPAGTSSTT